MLNINKCCEDCDHWDKSFLLIFNKELNDYFFLCEKVVEYENHYHGRTLTAYPNCCVSENLIDVYINERVKKL